MWVTGNEAVHKCGLLVYGMHKLQNLLFILLCVCRVSVLLVSQDSMAKGTAPDFTFEAILEFVQRKYK